MRMVSKGLAPIVALVLFAVFFLAACAATDSRLAEIYTYSPGAPFQTNFNYEDARRQVKCSIIFEVFDEKAIEEIDLYNSKVRNSVLCVLSELTLPEVTTEKNLVAIADRIVERVNIDLGANINLVLRAYFTDFNIA